MKRDKNDIPQDEINIFSRMSYSNSLSYHHSGDAITSKKSNDQEQGTAPCSYTFTYCI